MPNSGEGITGIGPPGDIGAHTGSYEHEQTWSDSDGNRWSVHLSIDSSDGHSGVRSFTITPERRSGYVTQSVLREFPLAEIERKLFEPNASHLVELAVPATTAPHRGRAHTFEELRLVAEVYTAALNARLPVQRTVAEKLQIPLSTAAKRIMAARREGLIPPVTRNRGENRD